MTLLSVQFLEALGWKVGGVLSKGYDRIDRRTLLEQCTEEQRLSEPPSKLSLSVMAAEELLTGSSHHLSPA